MNKYIYWKNVINNELSNQFKNYNCVVQFDDNVNGNAYLVKYEKKHIIFVSSRINKKLYPLVLFHELGHLKFNTLNSNPKEYNYITETLSNLYALFHLLFLFKFKQKIIMIILAIISERKLYNYFAKNNAIGGDFIYENFFTN